MIVCAYVKQCAQVKQQRRATRNAIIIVAIQGATAAINFSYMLSVLAGFRSMMGALVCWTMRSGQLNSRATLIKKDRPRNHMRLSVATSQERSVLEMRGACHKRDLPGYNNFSMRSVSECDALPMMIFGMLFF